MKITIEFNTDNWAFKEHPHQAVSDSLASAAFRAAEAAALEYEDGGPVIDSNGNTVGEWRVTHD